MNLPIITQLAKETARFVRYQDGNLWYSITWWPDGWDWSREFQFPIPTDAPELYDACRDAAAALLVGDPEGKLDRVRVHLVEAFLGHNTRGAGAGEFLAEDKAIRFLRWIRPQLEMLRAAQAAEQNG